MTDPETSQYMADCVVAAADVLHEYVVKKYPALSEFQQAQIVAQLAIAGVGKEIAIEVGCYTAWLDAWKRDSESIP
jgi:hypothetical protein